MTWKVWYYDDDCRNIVYVVADSFDKAVVEARKIDRRYCFARVVSK